MIRRAEEKDLGRIIDLLFQVQGVHAEGRPDLFRKYGIKYSEGQVLRIISDDDRPVYVYVDEKDIVQGYGFCIYQYVYFNTSMCDNKTCYIDDICIDENMRKKGVGEAIYKHIVECAKKDGCDRITLNVWECNPGARKFYEKMGLVPLKTMMEQKL